MITTIHRDFEPSTPTCAQREIRSYQYDLIKSYLHRAYIGVLIAPNMQILRLVAPADAFSYRSKPITVADDLEGTFIRVLDSKIHATITISQSLYDVSLFWEQQGGWISFYIYVFGLDSCSNKANELLELLVRESMLNSPYRNKCLAIEMRRSEDANLPGRPALSLARVDNQNLSGILLPEKIMMSIKLFIDAIKQHSELKLPMRYLLSGRPGTGKTRIIQAVANEAKGYATFIFANGSEECLDVAFEFADVFSPLVICIDDVDLIVGARDEGIYSNRLASFLQNLDGFVRQDFFLLATANDKRFVDLAARRPGRFDRVIDVDIIDSDQYLSLVRTKTSNEHILSLFDEAMLSALERKRVTGAFVANLVKQLEVMDRLSPGSLRGTVVKELIEELNAGFNEKGVSDTRVGFGLQN